MTSKPEKAVDGKTVYETYRDYQGILTTGRHLLAEGGGPWDELSWSDQDFWERQADEINESRRGTP